MKVENRRNPLWISRVSTAQLGQKGRPDPLTQEWEVAPNKKSRTAFAERLPNAPCGAKASLRWHYPTGSTGHRRCQPVSQPGSPGTPMELCGIFRNSLYHNCRQNATPRRSSCKNLRGLFCGYGSMATAVSRARRIMSVKDVCRSSAGRLSPVTRWSEMVQMARARLPARAALQ